MQLGVQISAIAFTIAISINYFRFKRLPLRSTRFFTAFILVSQIYMLFDLLTVYTITHMDSVYPWFNRLAHQLFIGSIDLIIMMLFFYVDMKYRHQRKYKIGELVLRLIPTIIALGFIIFGDLKYYVEEDGYYSYGMMANTIYGLVCVYLIPTICLVAKGKAISKQNKLMMLAGIFTWIVISLIQFFNPTWLLSSLGIVLMVFFISSSFESVDKLFVDTDSVVFAKNAFELTVEEKLELKEHFNLIVVKVANYANLLHSNKEETLKEKIDSFALALTRKTKGTVFQFDNQSFCIVFEHENEYLAFLNQHSMIDALDAELKIVFKDINCDSFKSIEDVLTSLNEQSDSLKVMKDGRSYNIKYGDIYYIEAVDNSTFIYSKDDCFEIKDKLYQIENNLMNDGFLRCSKSMICNLGKIKAVEKEKNSRLSAILLNDEIITISRQYVSEFKRKWTN